MRNERSKSKTWPMEYILGGILAIAVVVLVGFGLRPGDEERELGEQAATRAESRREASALRALPDRSSTSSTADQRPEAAERSIASEPLPAPEATGTAAPAVVDGALITAIPVAMSFAEAEALFHAGDFASAAAGFAAYGEENPSNPWGHYMLGLAEWRAGRIVNAEAALEQTTRLDPDHAKAWLNLARVRLAMDKPAAALTAAKRGAQLDTGSAAAARVLGRAQHSLGRPREAMESYALALTRDANDTWSLNNLGLVLIEQERFGEALPVLALAVELKGDVATFRNNLGVALERSGYPTSAALAYAGALEIEPAHEKALLSLARTEAQPVESGAPDLPALAAGLSERLAQGKLLWSALARSAGETAAADIAALPAPSVVAQPAASIPGELPATVDSPTDF